MRAPDLWGLMEALITPALTLIFISYLFTEMTRPEVTARVARLLVRAAGLIDHRHREEWRAELAYAQAQNDAGLTFALALLVGSIRVARTRARTRLRALTPARSLPAPPPAGERPGVVWVAFVVGRLAAFVGTFGRN